MQERTIECKDCRFWVQHVKDDPKMGPRLSDFGLCFHASSVNWFLTMHKNVSCAHGELKRKELLTH